MMLDHVATFLTSVLCTGFSDRLGKSLGIIDLPGHLKLQTRPVSRLGGLGIFCGVTIGLLMLPPEFHVALPGASLMFAVGLLDDRYNARPGVKLLGQALAGIGLAGSVLGVQGLSLDWVLMGFAILTITVVMANGVNLLDGMDGLAAGTAAIAFGSLALLYRLHGLQAEGCDVFTVATLGFLVWNFPRARVFMGDSGSLLLGCLLSYALTELLLVSPRLFLCGLVASGVPIFDLITGVVRRWLGRKSLFSGDREHFYDRLRISLKNNTEVVILIFCSGILLGGLALVLSFQPLGIVIAVAALLTGALLVGARALGWLTPGPEEAKVPR
jgi:UDP-GlcNAc:undecaprenyl-phosphate GlcNAc-1-phosphate transferase